MRGDEAVVFAGQLSKSPDRLTLFDSEFGGLPIQLVDYLFANFSYRHFSERFLPHYFTKPISRTYHDEVLFPLLLEVEYHLTHLPAILVGPREIGKSTSSCLMMPLHAVTCPSLVFLPDGRIMDMSKRFILFLGSTKAVAGTNVLNIEHELESNDALIRTFGSLYLDANGKPPHRRSWNQTSAELSNGTMLEAKGRRSRDIRGRKVRQWRPDMIIGEDLEEDQSVRSATSRRYDVDWMRNVVENTLDSGRGNLLINGTLLHAKGMLSVLMEWGHQHKWPILQLPIYEDTPDGREYLWEEEFGSDWVKRKLDNITQSAFDQEYLMRPQSGNPDISYEDFQFYDFEDIAPLLGTKELIVTMGVDPAARKQDKNSFTALVPMARMRKTNIRYVLPAVIKRLNITEKVNAIFLEWLRWKVQAMGIEINGFQIVLKELMDIKALEEGVDIRTFPITQTGEKELRISGTYGPISAGKIRFLKCQSHSVIIDQLINLYDTDYKDGADALEMANWAQNELIRLSRRGSRASAAIT